MRGAIYIFYRDREVWLWWEMLVWEGRGVLCVGVGGRFVVRGVLRGGGKGGEG